MEFVAREYKKNCLVSVYSSWNQKKYTTRQIYIFFEGNETIDLHFLVKPYCFIISLIEFFKAQNKNFKKMLENKNEFARILIGR